MKASSKEALRWFLQSVDDYQFVKWVLKEDVFFDKGCFISQQAGEEALKACLYALGKRRVIGHSLYEMVDEISGHDRRFKEISSEAKRLDRFYIPTRYPNGIPGGSPFQVIESLTFAACFLMGKESRQLIDYLIGVPIRNLSISTACLRRGRGRQVGHLCASSFEKGVLMGIFPPLP